MCFQFWSLGAADAGSEPSEHHRNPAAIKINEGEKIKVALYWNDQICLLTQENGKKSRIKNHSLIDFPLFFLFISLKLGGKSPWRQSH